MWIHEPTGSYQEFPAPAGEGWRPVTEAEAASILAGTWDHPKPIPSHVTRRQGRLALLGAGLLDAVEGLLVTWPDADGRRALQIEYESEVWSRSNRAVLDLGAHLGLTSGQIDELFTIASTL